jgi:hypothetical protein
MTLLHLITTLFHHNDYPARRSSSDWKPIIHPPTKKFLKDLPAVEGMSQRHLPVLVSILPCYYLHPGSYTHHGTYHEVDGVGLRITHPTWSFFLGDLMVSGV